MLKSYCMYYLNLLKTFLKSCLPAYQQHKAFSPALEVFKKGQAVTFLIYKIFTWVTLQKLTK